MPEWRYIAVRMTGDGPGEVVHTEVPLHDVQLTEVLSGPHELNASVLPKNAKLTGDDGLPLFGASQEWGVAFFAQYGDYLSDAAGILTECPEEPDGGYMLTGLGFTNYPNGMPYTSVKSYVQEDATNIFRQIWSHLQAEPGGNLGITVDAETSGVLMGTDGTGDEDGPYLLNWWETANLGEKIDELATRGRFDWLEKHSWQGEEIHHHIRLGFPTIGHRLTDAALVVGENVVQRPQYPSNGSDYASDILVHGAGEGSTMATGSTGRRTGRLRRVAVISDKGIQTNEAANTRANDELLSRVSLPSISELTVRQHSNMNIMSVSLGDEVPYIDPTSGLQTYVRLLTRTIKPAQPHLATFTVTRVDRGVL